MTYSSPSLHRARLDPGHVGAGVGLGDAQAGDLLALDRRHEVVLLLLLGAEQVDRRGRHVRVDRDAHAEPAAVGVRHLLGEHERAVVVAALAAVLLGVGEAEEAQLAHALEDPVRERGLLPLLRVRAQLLDDEVVDRLAQLVVLVGEDEVLARAGVVGLQDIGGGHGGTVPRRAGTRNDERPPEGGRSIGLRVAVTPLVVVVPTPAAAAVEDAEVAQRVAHDLVAVRVAADPLEAEPEVDGVMRLDPGVLLEQRLRADPVVRSGRCPQAGRRR